jgi:hypothetical protein
MSKLLHVVLQIAAVVVQLGLHYSGLVPAAYQPLVAATVGLAQAGLAVANHGGASAQVSK